MSRPDRPAPGSAGADPTGGEVTGADPTGAWGTGGDEAGGGSSRGLVGRPGWWGAALAVAPAAVVAVRWWSRPVVALALGVATLVLGALVELDLAQRRLPNRLVGPLAAGVAIGLAADALARSDGAGAVRAVAVGSALAATFLALSFVGSVGFGDVKLAWPVGAIAGWVGGGAVPVAVLAMTLSGAAVGGLVLLVGRNRRQLLPYGPFLAVGAVAGMLVGPA